MLAESGEANWLQEAQNFRFFCRSSFFLSQSASAFAGAPHFAANAEKNAETQKTLEKRLCGEPLEQPTQQTMEDYAALVATWHVCRSRIGGRAMEGPKFSKML